MQGFRNRGIWLMAIFKALTFDGVNSLSYGIYITGEAVYNAPERAVEMVTIPGKNGALALDQGRFENIEVTYRAGCFADSQADFAEKIRAFRNALASRYTYKRLTDGYNTDEYRMALYKSGLDADPVRYGTASEFDITFECKPQRFLTSGETAYNFVTSYQGLTNEDSVQLQTENGVDIEGGIGLANSIVNPTLFDSKPLIKVTGNGSVGIGSQLITVSGVSSSTVVYIDCETMEIYTLSGGIASGASSHVSFNSNDFPTIPPGTSGVSHTTAFEIIPRWWRI